ncbi:putative BTB domain-containing protein [Seiridium cardinale]
MPISTNKFSRNLLAAMARAQEQEENTDFRILCEGQDILVHKVVICCQSAVFRAACNSVFKEATSGTFDMVEDSLPLVQRMIKYFYTGDYDDGVEIYGAEGMDDPSAARINARVFALADKYQISGLQCLSVEKYCRALEQANDMALFLGTVPDVFTLTPDTVRGLRQVAIKFARKHLGNSLGISEIKDLYDETIREAPEFTKDLLEFFFKSPVYGSCTTCDSNQPMDVLQCRCQTCGKGCAHYVNGFSNK